MPTATIGQQQSTIFHAALESMLRPLELHHVIVTNDNDRPETPMRHFVLPLGIPLTFLAGAAYDHLRGIGDAVTNYAIAFSTEAAKAGGYALLAALINYALQQ